MKPIVFLGIAMASALGIGLFQRHQLNDLTREGEALGGRNPARASSTSRGEVESHSRNIGSITSRVGEERIPRAKAGLVVLLANRLEVGKDGSEPLSAEDFAPLDTHGGQIGVLELLAGLGGGSIVRLIDEIKADTTLDPSIREDAERRVIEQYGEASPEQAIALVNEMPSFPGRDSFVISRFGVWAMTDPADALHWFLNESAAGNPVTDLGAMRCQIPAIEARIDPAKAVDFALRQNENILDSAFDAFTLQNSGPRRGSEYSGLVHALNEAGKRSEDAEAVARIRVKCIRFISDRLESASFTEASAVVDGGFSPEEKKAFIARISSNNAHDEPEKWASWAMTSPEPVGKKHPLVRLLGDWMQQDPVAARDWLDQAPEGELKRFLVAKYVPTAK